MWNSNCSVMSFFFFLFFPHKKYSIPITQMGIVVKNTHSGIRQPGPSSHQPLIQGKENGTGDAYTPGWPQSESWTTRAHRTRVWPVGRQGGEERGLSDVPQSQSRLCHLITASASPSIKRGRWWQQTQRVLGLNEWVSICEVLRIEPDT